MIAAQEKPNYAYSEVPAYESPPEPRERVQSERRARMVLTALILSAFVLGIVYVLFNAFTTNVGYRLENLKREVAAIDAENQSLEMLINKHDSLVRIEALAVAELGMVAPAEENTLTVPIADPSVLRQPDNSDPPAAPAAEGERLVADAAVRDKSDPSLLEALLSFISGREPSAESV